MYIIHVHNTCTYMYVKRDMHNAIVKHKIKHALLIKSYTHMYMSK